MNKFPLAALSFYRVKKDFVSARSRDSFTKDTILQFQSRDTNVYECIEILEFIVWETREKKVWHFPDMDETERLKGWNSYLELVDKGIVVS